MSLTLPTEDRVLYQALLDVSGEQKLYLVGGYARDLLLNIKTRDLDFMIERNLKEFLEVVKGKFAKELGVALAVSHSRFFTAKLNFENPFQGHSSLDFSQARRETYSKPGSRPDVSEGTLQEDILRRDFTINSIAIHKDQLVDLTGGQKDIAAKLIKIHHDESFRDDPIRLIRAVRFATRFSFSLESKTAVFFDAAVRANYLSLVSPRRRFEELRKVLSETKREEILKRLETEGLLAILCPAIRANVPSIAAALSIEEALLGLVEKGSRAWSEYVDTLGLPKAESTRLKR